MISDLPLYDQPKLSPYLFFPRRGRHLPPQQGSKKIELLLADGSELGALWLRHLPDAPTLLLFHGDGENIEDQLYIWPRLLKDLKINGMFMDYPGYSTSRGQPDLSHSLAGAMACLRFLLQQPAHRVPAVFLMGRSFGSLFAVNLAHRTRSPRLRGLILESAIGDVKQWFDQTVPLAMLGLDRERCLDELCRDFGHKERMRHIKIPTLLLHTKQDQCLSVDHAHILAQWSADRLWRKVIFAEGDHNSVLRSNAQVYQQHLRDFVTTV